MNKPERYTIRQLIADAAALGVAQYIRDTAPASDEISQSEAFRQFGRRTVERWLAQSSIFPVRRGTTSNSKRYYSRAQLIALHMAEQMKFNILDNPAVAAPRYRHTAQ